MRNLSTLVLLAIVLTTSALRAQAPASRPEVYFSPNGGATDAIVRNINAARSWIFVQAYSFTSAPIAKALVDAHKRGVQVRVILDKSQRTDRYSSADFLANSGITTLIDAEHAIAHSKVILIDNQTVITGSFNFTKAAEERNAENVLILRDAQLLSKYYANWKDHAAHSETYKGRMGSSSTRKQ